MQQANVNMLDRTKKTAQCITVDNGNEADTQLKENKHQVSFLRWINPFANTSHNTTNKSSEVLSDEYRGVQSLKQFWNNRICASKDAKQKSATLGRFSNSISTESNLSASKSVNCLLSNQKYPYSFRIRSKEAEDRNQIDNFYKYKTAATHKQTNHIVVGGFPRSKSNEAVKKQKPKGQKFASFGGNFPLVSATESGEKIHWAKREDIFVNHKQKQSSFNSEISSRESPNSDDNEKFLSFSHSPNSSSTEMAIKSSATTITISTVRSSSDKTDSRSSHNGSTNSLSSESPVRKRISTPRKYSFKTHAKHYYVPRKMAINTSGSKVAALTHQFNQMIQKDAAILKEVKKKNGVLMMRAGHVYKIKEESDVGRKKTKDDDVSVKSYSKKKSTLKKHTVSKSSDSSINDEKTSSNVRATIQKFETKDGDTVDKTVLLKSPTVSSKLKKPEVPTKSEHVLRRTKEIAVRNSQKRMKVSVSEQSSENTTILENIKEEPKKDSNQTNIDANIQDDAMKNVTVIFLAGKSISHEEEKQKSIESESLQTEKLQIRIESENLQVEDTEYSKVEIKEIDLVTESAEICEVEDSQKRKSKYSRLYERFLFHSPFSSMKKAPATEKPEIESICPEIHGEQKIIDALDAVNKRLDHLSKSTSDIQGQGKEEHESSYEEMALKIRPNESFLFRQNSKNILNNSTATVDTNPQLIEAVNIKLISKTQSMDESRFPSSQMRQISLEDREYPNILKHTDEIVQNFRNLHKQDESFYEPISVHSENQSEVQEKFIFKSQNVHRKKQNVPEIEESIYQTVAEAKCNQCNSINSYESYDNYELVANVCENNTTAGKIEDDYDICDPPEPPPPRKSEADIRNTTDELPAIPSPKRIVPSCGFLEAECGAPPPRPPKSPQIHNRPKLPEIPHEPPDDNHCHLEPYDDDNIYDTIKGSESSSHCYEMVHSKNVKSLDAVSLTSNCYESINSLRRVPVLRHSDSVSTLSSEQKTNSLYGIALGRNSSPPNEIASDNSDEWIDISDGEEEKISSKHHFIVVRERAKCHRSPVWSKKVRDQRIHQQTAACDDDSDHYYEPLFVLGEKDINAQPRPCATQTEASSEKSRPRLPALILTENGYQQSTGEHCYSDEYDSFDSEDETDEDVKKHDSGVDISNAKLPDPPPSTNQVYAFVKKFKNFISIKKLAAASSSSKNSDYQGKPYENTQFYVSSETDYQNVSLNEAKNQKSGKLKTPKFSKKPPKITTTSADESYENAEFHTPRVSLGVTPQSPSSTSSPYTTPVLNHAEKLEKSENSSPLDSVNRKKSKTGKSFKSKFRKSLASPDADLNIGSALNGTRSTFYISDSVDMDSGIFEKVPQTDSTNLSQSSVNEFSQNEKSSTVSRKSKKSHSPELSRRKTTIGIRPNSPPPPPPIDKKNQRKRISTTSWYAECGVFKTTPINDEFLLKESRKDRVSSTSWYAEAGLYQTSGASVASSSGSSGVSTGGEGGPGDENSHSMFSNEPLYQIYSAAKLESISRDMEDQESADGYEEIGTTHSSEEKKKSSRPSALQIVGPKQGPSRTLWSEIPEVISSHILSMLTPTERRLQEAKFEILTSEASYLKSLNLLRSHFMNHPAFRDTSVLSSSDRKMLFSHIVPVHECSDRLLSDLEECWQDNIMLLGLSKSLYKHADKYFHVYIKFCEQQGRMDRTLRKLKEAKGSFSHALELLETDPLCCGLNLHSFLMLPMQRITRLPLLIDAVFSKLKADDDEFEDWKMTLAILNKIVAQCNDAANRCEQAYEIERISRQMEFPSNIRSIAIAPVGVPAPGTKPRALVKKGELMHLIWRGDDAKLTFGKKFAKCNIYAFLFTDLLVLTKRKGEEQFLVFDYCPRSLLTVSSGEVVPQLPTKDITQAGKNLILMTLLENHEGKTIEMLLSCPSVSEQQRWLQATTPPESENPDEKLYEQWDCPQVIAKHEFCATEPDLLNLEPGDVVNVTRKMADGWYQGERIRDGASGWFPGNYTEEVNSAHVRARNLKQRYRLLTLTATYLDSQKRKI